MTHQIHFFQRLFYLLLFSPNFVSHLFLFQYYCALFALITTCDRALRITYRISSCHHIHYSNGRIVTPDAQIYYAGIAKAYFCVVCLLTILHGVTVFYPLVKLAPKSPSTILHCIYCTVCIMCFIITIQHLYSRQVNLKISKHHIVLSYCIKYLGFSC